MEVRSNDETSAENGLAKRNGLPIGLILLILLTVIGAVALGYGGYLYGRSTQPSAPVSVQREVDAEKRQSELVYFAELRPTGVFGQELLLNSPEMHSLQLGNEWQSVECLSHTAANDQGQILKDEERGFINEIGTAADVRRLMRESRADYAPGRKVMDVDALTSALQRLESQDLMPEPTGCEENGYNVDCLPRPEKYAVWYNQLCRDEENYYVFYTLVDSSSLESGLDESEDTFTGAIEMKWSNKQLAVLPIDGGDQSRHDLQKISNAFTIVLSSDNDQRKISGEGLWNSCTHVFGVLGGDLYFACKGYGEGASGEMLFRLENNSSLLTKVAMCQNYVDYAAQNINQRYGCWDRNKKQYLNFDY